jgi:uncharacterized protein (DUF1786 family)
MQILTVDIGAGTQDIFLYDSRLDIENGYKLVVPSPTMIVHQRIREATHLHQPILLRGVTMGGGPSQWATEAHLRAGLKVYATPDAARTFNDDLEAVQALGITVVSEDEACQIQKTSGIHVIELRDFDFAAIRASLAAFGLNLDSLAAVAVAVFDHGNAPPGVSDRQFRFDYLEQRLRSAPSGVHAQLASFAFASEQIPESMTRLQAVAQCGRQAGLEIPLLVMDTAPAAVLGALYDPRLASSLFAGPNASGPLPADPKAAGSLAAVPVVSDPMLAGRRSLLVANIGNFHTLAFRLGAGGVEGVFEHHTGLIDRATLESLLLRLADGSLQHADVFSEHGHGALILSPGLLELGIGDFDIVDFDIVVTGPRRSLLNSIGDDARRPPARLRPYFASPFGDMMLSGCYGLLAACAHVLPDLAEPIHLSLSGAGPTHAPWG